MGSLRAWAIWGGIALLSAGLGASLVRFWQGELPHRAGQGTRPRCRGADHYRPAVKPRIAIAGSSVTVTGPLPVRDEAGNYVGPRSKKVELWWNLSPRHWPSAVTGEISEPIPARPGEPAVKLGQVFPKGHCSYEFVFQIPAEIRGRYSLVAIDHGGGGAASLPPTWVRVVAR